MPDSLSLMSQVGVSEARIVDDPGSWTVAVRCGSLDDMKPRRTYPITCQLRSREHCACPGSGVPGRCPS